MSSNIPTLFIIYNATSTLFGKANYVYRKLASADPASKPACAACELTHGPTLRLDETEQWGLTKQRISNANVSQVHQNEMPAALADWMKSADVATPAVVVKEPEAQFKLLLNRKDLARVRHDHAEFLRTLQERLDEERVPAISVRVD